MIGMVGCFAFVWALVISLASQFPAATGSIYTGGIGASVTLGLFFATREQGRRRTTLELHKEYYSADMADDRRKGSRFMWAHRHVDWTQNDPYKLGSGDDDLDGYSSVIRFWHRVAILYEGEEINRNLASRLFARELGEWHARIFYPMRDRTTMYVLPSIKDLCRHIQYGSGRSAFWDGYRNVVRADKPKSAIQSRADRWTTL